MNQNSKQFILQLLDIIGYEDDKEKYANEFLTLCVEKTITSLLSTLPEEKQSEFKDKLAPLTQEAEIEKLVYEYFSKKQYEEEFKNASKVILENYLKTVAPTLSEEQKNNLQSFFTPQPTQ